MGPATIRRFALVAALMLLAPIWCRPSATVAMEHQAAATVVGLAPSGTSPAPAIRRHLAAGWWTVGSRAGHTRGLLAVGVLALLSLLRLASMTMLQARPWVPPLARRRHAIALRAPPIPSCA